MRRVQVFVNGAGPVRARRNPPVAPRVNQAFALELAEMDEKPLAKLFIAVGIRKKDAERRN